MNTYEFLPPLDLREHSDGVERYRDIEVAHWLGSSTDEVRTLIVQRREELEQYGKILPGISPSGAGGVGYWLNFKQLLRLCMWLDTDEAHMIQWLIHDLVCNDAEVRTAIQDLQLHDLEQRLRESDARSSSYR